MVLIQIDTTLPNMKIVNFHWGIVGRRSVLLRQCLCGANLPKWLTLIINVLSDLLNHADPVICFASTIQKMFTFQVSSIENGDGKNDENCILVNYYFPWYDEDIFE